MIRQTMVWRIVASLVWVVPATVLLSAQTAGSPSAGGPFAFFNSLSEHAQHADSPAGDLNYATVLTRMTASHVSRDDIAELARRLASADQAARHDPRKYIPETAIAAAFNGLMAQVQNSYVKPFRADALTVHRIRLVLADKAPALTSVKEHPNSCLPDEAVLLTVLLKINNGRVVFVPRGQPMPPLGETFRAENATEDAEVRLDQYLDAHSTKTNMALFTNLLQDMGM